MDALRSLSQEADSPLNEDPAFPDLSPRKTRPTLVGTHKYRTQLEELLVAGWSPTSINAHLSKLFPDYVPVAPRTLHWYRHERLRDRLRPLEEFQRRLRDEHVLLDPIRDRAALILVQQSRVQKALDLEAQMTGIVLPIVGHEIDRLMRMWDGYEAACERLGLMPDSRKPVVINAPLMQQVNVYEEMDKQIADWPDEAKVKFADALRIARETRAAKRMAEVDARIQASLPEGNGEESDRE